jgi:hypothetical protein
MKEQVKIKINESAIKQSPFTKGMHKEYKLTLSYKGEEFNFTFHDSVYSYEKKIKFNKDDALNSVLLDASAYEQTRDEKEFLNEFGYNEFDLYNYYQNGYTFADMYGFAADKDVDNLRAGLKAYKECERTYDALNRIFTSEELDELHKEFAEY